MLTGAILNEIVGLLGMEEIWLEENMLTGSLPTEFGMASNLSKFYPSLSFQRYIDYTCLSFHSLSYMLQENLL